MTKKMTKVEMFNAIKAVEGVSANEDFVAFIDHEIELLNKKASNKKATKTQVENEGFKATILAVLTDVGATVTEIQGKDETLASLSNQRVSALLRQLKDDGKVVRYTEGKKTLFKLA